MKLKLSVWSDTLSYSSKDMGKKGQQVEYKRRNQREPVKKEDVTRHMVAAFVSFIDRQLARETVAQLVALMERAKCALNTAYSLQEDESLNVPRNIEDIFFRDVGNIIKIEKAKDEQEIYKEEEDKEEKS